MALQSIDPTTTSAWKELTVHFNKIKDKRIQQLTESDPDRIDKMRICFEEITLDFSKQRVSAETLLLLEKLANEVRVKDSIDKLFAGSKINNTEDRAVLHTALRDFHSMKPEVKNTLQRMKQFSDSVIEGSWKGFTNKPITDIVNIGIGGSHLGPEMVMTALSYYSNHLKVHFISNIDGDHVQETLKGLDRETTLFIIVSKTFTTQETLTNSNTVRNWFLEDGSISDISKHFAAVSTNLQAVQDFGISPDTIFPMWNWVGGRFSLWSAVGLSICCGTGYQNFEKLLKGARNMDMHFKNASITENIPVIMALLSVWNTNFLKAETEAVIPYSHYLSQFVPYLQQLVMESNGKSTARDGTPIHYHTSPIVWGSAGTNAQHAYFQLIHQGTRLVPVEFIIFSESLFKDKDAHRKLMANCIAQSEALMKGTYGKFVENGFKSFEGNKPSTTLVIKKLTPESLGQLLALYEHKTFVQGVIWNICSFDQWGVELGKKIANSILSSLED